MYKLSFFIDEIFKLGLIFFISLVFYRAMGLSLTVCILVASITAISICLFFFYLKLKRDTKNALKAEQLNKIDKIKTQFQNASTTEIRTYLSELFNISPNAKGELIKTENNYCAKNEQEAKNISNFKQGEKNALNATRKILYIPFFHIDTFTPEKLQEIYRQNKNRKLQEIVILCNNYTSDCNVYIKNYQKIKYSILTLKELFTLYIEPLNIYPNIEVEIIPKEKMNFHKLKEHIFDRKRSKSYFFCGLILLFSSYFVPLKIYYLIFSGLMFTMSLISITLHKFKSTN